MNNLKLEYQHPRTKNLKRLRGGTNLEKYRANPPPVTPRKETDLYAYPYLRAVNTCRDLIKRTIIKMMITL
jgi:hypothetical protein